MSKPTDSAAPLDGCSVITEQDLQAECARLVPECVKVVVEVMSDEKVLLAIRRRAAGIILGLARDPPPGWPSRYGDAAARLFARAVRAAAIIIAMEQRESATLH